MYITNLQRESDDKFCAWRKCMLWDLRLSQWCSREFKSSGISSSVTGWTVADVLKYQGAFTFETAYPCWWRHHHPSKCQEQLTQWHRTVHINISTVGHLLTEDKKGINEDSHWDRHYIPELLRKCFWAVLGRGGQTNIIHVSVILGMNNAIICTRLSFKMFPFPPLNAQSFTFLLKIIFF